jgi:hypothetical protein
MVSRFSLRATGTEPGQRLDISEDSRWGQDSRGQRKRGVSTHPIIVKDAVADLDQYVPRRLLKREFHVLS